MNQRRPLPRRGKRVFKLCLIGFFLNAKEATVLYSSISELEIKGARSPRL
jgi:hypothetical protein